MNSTQLIGQEHRISHLTTNHFFRVHYSTRIHIAHQHEQHEYNMCVCSFDFLAESVDLLVVTEITHDLIETGLQALHLESWYQDVQRYRIITKPSRNTDSSRRRKVVLARQLQFAHAENRKNPL